MSGGFFRGTSADQDTRFSNKQAKLLKSQKFAPELDHLVDMTKVKMDVIRPWIATRATEFLGFEDEVLINFVYGLLDKKEVDGKQIQIQLTGFMEKNTGKFMKELWGLLLSAQNNVSGVPQQFLDAKEAETRKKKVETDRIAQEIQKRRDRDVREPERERKSGFDGEGDSSKFTKDASDSVSKFSKMPRASSVQPEEDGEADEMHGSAAKNGRSRSPHSTDRSPSPARALSPTRSYNKSIMRSRSKSEERHKSRSLSVSSQSPRRSVSPGRHYQSPKRRSRSPKRPYRSPPRRSISPHRRHSIRVTRSPLRRRSPPPRRRSRSRQRSPSPSRYRSPLVRRRSPRRRSPSPYRRRSPPRRRSPSPYRRRSPSPHHRRSPSPLRHRSPVKARRRSPSPVRRRSPIRQRSVSPAGGRSTSPLRRRSPPPRSPKHRRRSPLRSPKNRTAESPISPPRKRSPSPHGSPSPSPKTRRSLSREHDSRTNGNDSRRYRNEQTSRRDEQTSRRVDARKSPANHIFERELAERTKQKVSESVSRKAPISLRSPQRDRENRSGDRRKMPVVSLEHSLSNSESPTAMQKVNPRTTRSSRSLSKSPIKQTGSRMHHQHIPGTSEEEEHMTRARNDSSQKRSRDLLRDVSPESRDRRKFRQSPAASGCLPHSELKKKDRRQESDVSLPERHAPKSVILSEEIEYPSGRVRDEKGALSQHDRERSAKLLKRDTSLERMKHHYQVVNDESKHRQSGDEYSKLHRGTESIPKSKKKMDKETRLDTIDSDCEETDSYRNENMEKRRHKKSDKRKRDDDESSESDSQIEDTKESKKRRKEEKKQRKDEKRRRREERHHRKLERRAAEVDKCGFHVLY